jgi:hypothetical protein
VPGGGLSMDKTSWIGCKPGFFLPVRVLSKVFRGKFIDGLKKARKQGKLLGVESDAAFGRLLNASVKHDWVVYAKRPFGGPQQVLKYLARYTHRIAISNRRLVAMDDRTVTFRYKDYAQGSRPRTMTLDGNEFLRRFLLHAVPSGFMRIRHFGLLANRMRADHLAACRTLLADPAPRAMSRPIAAEAEPPRCPACGKGQMVRGPRLSAPEVRRIALRLDSS